jgi:hypothetical protein
MTLLQVLNNMQHSKRQVAAFAKRWAQAVKQQNTPASQQLIRTGNCVQDPETHLYVVAPAVDGRMKQVQQAAVAEQQAQAGAGL